MAFPIILYLYSSPCSVHQLESLPREELSQWKVQVRRRKLPEIFHLLTVTRVDHVPYGRWGGWWWKMSSILNKVMQLIFWKFFPSNRTYFFLMKNGFHYHSTRWFDWVIPVRISLQATDSIDGDGSCPVNQVHPKWNELGHCTRTVGHRTSFCTEGLAILSLP